MVPRIEQDMQINSRLLGIAILAVPALVHAQGVPKPNVLVIVLDDVAVDKVTSYAGDYPGYAPTYLPSTQTLDTLASRGLRFKRAWATPLCSSTRVALETGKQPWRTGIGTALGNAAVGVDPALHLTLGESFQLDGYDTGKFGKHHMGTRDAAGAVGYPASSPYFVEPHVSLMGWDRFFGDYDGYVGAAPGVGYFNWKRVDWLGGTATGYTAMENTGTHATDRVIGVAGDWITSRTQPWLAMVSLHAGHSGTTASTTWTVADVDTNPTNYRTASLSCLAAGTCLDEKRQAYRALVEHADIAIAELLTRLPQTTIDNTL
ncbi:MAG TPA: sulfatase-like hydrolase/transferase, partial [Kofleriaceae bacterium]|nr:sulfatase-like hydrolase/transferase [Kofleriaceae bacterium]